MTKKESIEQVLRSLESNGVTYSTSPDVVRFSDITILFDNDYINVRAGKNSSHYALSTLSHLSIMAGALWISGKGEYNLTTIQL